MRSYVLTAALLILAPWCLGLAADDVQSARDFAWLTRDGTTLARATETYRSAPTGSDYRLDLRLADGTTVQFEHSYDPWDDRHSTRLVDPGAGWWIEHTSDTELSFDSTREGVTRGPLLMVRDNPMLRVELSTSDGWRREVSGPARMAGPSAEKRLRVGDPKDPLRMPASSRRALSLMRRALAQSEVGRLEMIRPLVEALEPAITGPESAFPDEPETLTLVESPPVRVGDGG